MDKISYTNPNDDFHRAIIKNDCDALKNLVKSKPISPLSLHIAACYGRNKCMKFLLEHGANPHEKTEEENTLFHLVRTAKAAQILFDHLDHRVKVNARNKKGDTPLSMALFDTACADDQKNKESLEIAYILLKHGADINVDNEEDSLLHRAIIDHRPAVVDFLLQNNIDTNKHDIQGLTAFDIILKECALWGATFEFFLPIFEKYGMVFFPRVRPSELFNQPEWLFRDVDYDNSNNVLLLNNWARLFACKKHYSWKRDSMTKSGVVSNQYGCIAQNISREDLIHYFGQFVGPIENELLRICSYALPAIKEQRFDSLQFLMGTFPFIIRYHDETACSMIMEAIKLPDTRYLQILLGNHRDHHLHVTYLNKRCCVGGGTFLHQAVFENNPGALELLMNAGVDYFRQNNDGQTPLEYAQALGREHCVFALNILLSQKCNDEFWKRNYKKSKRFLQAMPDCSVYLENGKPLLHNIIEGPVAKVLKFIPLLRGKKVDVNQLDKYSQMVLWQLMKYHEGKLPIITALLCAGARDRTNYLLDLALFRGDFALAKLFVQHGAVVIEKEILSNMYNNKVPQELKTFLEQKYNEQCCCICFERPFEQDLFFIPCNNNHSEFLCKQCCKNLHECPLCGGMLQG